MYWNHCHIKILSKNKHRAQASQSQPQQPQQPQQSAFKQKRSQNAFNQYNFIIFKFLYIDLPTISHFSLKSHLTHLDTYVLHFNWQEKRKKQLFFSLCKSLNVCINHLHTTHKYKSHDIFKMVLITFVLRLLSILNPNDFRSNLMLFPLSQSSIHFRLKSGELLVSIFCATFLTFN